MALRGGFSLIFSAFEPTGVAGQNASETPHYTSASKNYSNGESAGTINGVYSKRFEIAGGGADLDIDLSALTDSDGDDLVIGKGDVILLENLSDDADAVMKVSPGAVNGITDLLAVEGGSGSPVAVLRLRKGAKFMVADGNCDFTTGSTLSIANASADKTLTGRFRIMGRAS